MNQLDINKRLDELAKQLMEEYAEMEYTSDNDADRFAVFGVYANQNMKNAEGTIVIEKDSFDETLSLLKDDQDGFVDIKLPDNPTAE